LVCASVATPYPFRWRRHGGVIILLLWCMGLLDLDGVWLSSSEFARFELARHGTRWRSSGGGAPAGEAEAEE
jgi:hypothetical protein